MEQCSTTHTATEDPVLGELRACAERLCPNDDFGELGGKSWVSRDANERFEAFMLEHELSLGEEVVGKCVEQLCLDLPACPSKGTKLCCREEGADSDEHFLWQFVERGRVRASETERPDVSYRRATRQCLSRGY